MLFSEAACPPSVQLRPPHGAEFQRNSSVMSFYKVDKRYCCRRIPTQELASHTHTSIHPSVRSVSPTQTEQQQQKTEEFPFCGDAFIYTWEVVDTRMKHGEYSWRLVDVLFKTFDASR